MPGPEAPLPRPPRFEKSPAPEWGGAPRIEPVLGSAAAAPVAGNALPAGFDAEGFARNAKLQFVRLQAAHDAGDRETLRDVLTPEMLRGGHARPRQRCRAPGDRSREPSMPRCSKPGPKAIGTGRASASPARCARVPTPSRLPSTKSGTWPSPSTARRAGSSPAYSKSPEMNGPHAHCVRCSPLGHSVPFGQPGGRMNGPHAHSVRCPPRGRSAPFGRPSGR